MTSTTSDNPVLKPLIDKVKELNDTRDKIELAEETLKNLKGIEEKLSSLLIPNMMTEFNVSSFSTEFDDKLYDIKTSVKYMGSLKDGHRCAAEPLLIKHGQAAILIKKVLVEDNMNDLGEAPNADLTQAVLSLSRVPEQAVEIKIDCHHATLKKALKELMAANVTVSVKELLGYYDNSLEIVIHTFFPHLLDENGGFVVTSDFEEITELPLANVIEKVFGVYQVVETEIKEKKKK